MNIRKLILQYGSYAFAFFGLMLCFVVLYWTRSTNSDTQPFPKREKIRTPFVEINKDEFHALAKADALADCSNLGLVTTRAKLPQIPSKMVQSDNGSAVAFEWHGKETKVHSESGSARVFVLGNECLVADEEQCGSGVILTRLHKSGERLYQVKEYHHAHSVCSLARNRGLVFVFLFESNDADSPGGSMVKAYDWKSGIVKGRIFMESTQSPVLAVTADEKHLIVAPRGGIPRQYDIDSAFQ